MPCGPPNDTIRTASNTYFEGGTRLRRTTFARRWSELAGLPTIARSRVRRAKVGGEAGIRTLGRTLKALQRFSKPPPSASRPPHRTSASIRDQDSYTETPGQTSGERDPARAVAVTAKYNYESALHGRYRRCRETAGISLRRASHRLSRTTVGNPNEGNIDVKFSSFDSNDPCRFLRPKSRLS
jgi:hypothetical protein